MKRALITGITGQDGSYLAELLLAGGYEVTGLVRPGPDPQSSNIAAIAARIALVEADLSDTDSLRAAVADSAPDEIFHLAAPTSVAASWDDPEGVSAMIAGATEVLIAAAEALPDARFYVSTSSEIFGDSGESPQNEDSPKRPRSPYGEAKLRVHEQVASARDRGLFAVSGITYNHESPRRPAHFLPRKVTRGAAAIALGVEDKLELGDLGAVRDWSDARDVMRGAALTLTADIPRDYIFASGVGRTVQDLVNAAFSAAGVDPAGRIDVNPEFVRPPEPTLLVGDPSRARSDLGWRAEISFEEMIAEMVAADLELLR